MPSIVPLSGAERFAGLVLSGAVAGCTRRSVAHAASNGWVGVIASLVAFPGGDSCAPGRKPIDGQWTPGAVTPGLIVRTKQWPCLLDLPRSILEILSTGNTALVVQYGRWCSSTPRLGCNNQPNRRLLQRQVRDVFTPTCDSLRYNRRSGVGARWCMVRIGHQGLMETAPQGLIGWHGASHPFGC